MNGEDKNAKNYTVEELFSEAKRSRMMFFDGGGVTFTGGECTLQHEELTELLSAAGCRDVVWKFPEETGFYQPIVLARK